ncbi:MAG: helix-turn-helix transcriptional regulator [Clostridia bacterium]|nr:helix-turn-helix transcriptional regulator [Clostridia bacterium]
MKEFEMLPVEQEIKIDGFNSIYYFEFGKDFTHPPEVHDFWEFAYVDSGEIIAVTDGLGQTLKQGQIMFHRPMEVHAHISNKVTPNNMLVVTFTCSSPAMNFFDKRVFELGKNSKMLLTLFAEEARHIFGSISGDYNNKNPLGTKHVSPESLQLLQCYLTEFLIKLKRQDENSGSRIKKNEISRDIAHSSITELIIAYLEENVYQNITTQDLCKKFYMSKSQLYQLFSDYSGDSPIHYHLKLKMAEAKKLLRDNKMTVSDVADILGYTSIHNFSRAFKNAAGLSPAKYKNKILSGE